MSLSDHSLCSGVIRKVKDNEGKEVKARRGRKVTECSPAFRSYVAVRGTHPPKLVPELTAYQATIMRDYHPPPPSTGVKVDGNIGYNH